MGQGGPEYCSKWYVVLVASSVVMVACGGGEPGSTGTTPAPTFADYAALDAQLHAAWDAQGATDPSTLPGSGSATYQGVVNLDAQLGSSNLAMSGSLQLTADFGASTIAGSANSFKDQFERAFSGTLTLSNGAIDRAANPATEDSFTADLDGTLSGAGEVLSIGSDLLGDFLGGTAGAATGVVTGLVGSSFGTGALFGDFIAEN